MLMTASAMANMYMAIIDGSLVYARATGDFELYWQEPENLPSADRSDEQGHVKLPELVGARIFLTPKDTD